MVQVLGCLIWETGAGGEASQPPRKIGVRGTSWPEAEGGVSLDWIILERWHTCWAEKRRHYRLLERQIGVFIFVHDRAHRFAVVRGLRNAVTLLSVR